MGGPANPCLKRQTSTGIAGATKTKFNKNTYHLTQEHEEIVETELNYLMECMKII
jgi:hypothetical protein